MGCYVSGGAYTRGFDDIIAGQPRVDFAGFEVTSEGCKPLRKMTGAFQKFLVPRNKTPNGCKVMVWPIKSNGVQILTGKRV